MVCCAAAIASPSLHVKDVVWEMRDSYLPVNRVEAAMWMNRQQKDCGGKLALTPKAVAHAEGTNMVRTHTSTVFNVVKFICCELQRRLTATEHNDRNSLCRLSDLRVDMSASKAGKHAACTAFMHTAEVCA